MALIYHIASKQDWEMARSKGEYVHPSLQSEGFIHCSEDHQLAGVLERYFEGKNDLIKLTIDTDKLNSRLQYDHAPSVNEPFPHIYGPVNLNAVMATEQIS